jgi:hypothetical protein
MRIELRDGQWAVLRERITHGVDKELKRAITRAKLDPVDAFDFDTAVVAAFVREWNVKDPDGTPITLTNGDPTTLSNLDAVMRAPDDVIEALSKVATPLWTAVTVPNAPTPVS